MAGGRDRLPSVQIENGKLVADRDVTTTTTDAAGRFSIAREPDPLGQYFAVVVVHPEFYAEVNGRGSKQIRRSSPGHGVR